MGVRGIRSPIKIGLGSKVWEFASTSKALEWYFMENADKDVRPERFAEIAKHYDCSVAMPGIIYKKMVMAGKIPPYYEKHRTFGPKMTLTQD